MGNLIMRVRHMEMNPPLKQLWQKIQIIFFVMDRDSAIGTEGAQLAQEIMENELVMSTDAYKMEILFIWNIRQYGIQLKVESLH